MKIFNLLQTKFNRFESAIQDHLAKHLSNNGSSYGNNTIFGQLINVLGAVVQNMILYIEDSLIEQNKYTAQRKKSIYGLAASSGYSPSLGKAANVQIAMSYTPNNYVGAGIVINNHEQLTCTQNGLTYNMILPQEAIIMSIDKDNSTKYIQAVQGRYESQSFVSSGGRYYTINFKFNGNLDADYLTVKVNNEYWSYVESFYDMGPDMKQWTYKISPSSGVDIIFGNDRHGKALSVNDVIDIEYLIHDGELGNLDVLQDTYFVFNNNLHSLSGEEIDGNSVFNITFATTDSVTAGTNSESIEQVRHMIGLNSRSLVLASPDHYRTFINKFSFCGYNRTWSERGSMIVNSLIMKNYKLHVKDGKDYFNLTPNDFILSKTQKQTIIDSVDSSGMQLAGVTYNIFDPELCKYAMYLYVKLKSINYDKEYITTKIYNTIGEFFSNVQSDMFIPKSDIIYALKENIDEIDGVDVYILSELNERAIATGSYVKRTYTFNSSTNTYDKKEERVYVYPGDNPLIGLDEHGNISLQTDEQFPVLMANWDYKNNEGDEVNIKNALTIIYS